ncbi:MAG: UDP-N-acetylglucosamine--N-acetylmuramyl-(pentapeptide) pyrophosphoryl-undecaprenol N-acetylglucosamine transferase [Parcubacteria group bacterium]|nr:UDP-N-acetylglucosamine--N-acetylmuramyl-(pentapeptide) pyrophosphoryl-undecaprenol N-acetylglucosamine transferase [Parcubacteria group bacterium]
MKILLAGGGTLGSVNPLIAMYEEAKKQHKSWDWFWVGTRSGIERSLIGPLSIGYEWVPAIKLRRYFSLRVLVDPFFLALAFLRSLLIVMVEKPDVIIGAGSFVSVPVIWAGWLFRKKIIIHQQDIRPTLSNKLCAPFASKITVSFKKSLEDFPKAKAEWIGNPARDALKEANPLAAASEFHFDATLPVVLITGGSSGAEALNAWVWKHLLSLTRAANVVHLAGRGKMDPSQTHERYRQVEFLGPLMPHALAAADLAITRGGIGTITELGHLRKAAIIIPMPGTHQEDNAFYCLRERAAVVYRQDQLDETVVRRVRELLESPEKREALGRALAGLLKEGARERMVNIIASLGGSPAVI